MSEQDKPVKRGRKVNPDLYRQASTETVERPQRRLKQIAQEDKRKQSTESFLIRLPVGKRDEMQAYVASLNNPEYIYKNAPSASKWVIDLINREMDTDVIQLSLPDGMIDKIRECVGSEDPAAVSKWITQLITNAIDNAPDI